MPRKIYGHHVHKSFSYTIIPCTQLDNFAVKTLVQQQTCGWIYCFINWRQ